MSDGGPAFPPRDAMIFYYPESVKDDLQKAVEDMGDRGSGMSILDYFAGQALAGLLSDNNVGYGEDAPEKLASCSYEFASVMLAEREKRTK